VFTIVNRTDSTPGLTILNRSPRSIWPCS